MKGLYYITFFVLAWIPSTVFAQWDTTWTKTYGGNRDDVFNDMIVTPDNGFLMVGSTSSFEQFDAQMYFVKLDSNGNVEWSKSHGGLGQEGGNSIIMTSDGGYLAAGYTNSWGYGGYDLLLVKLNASGNLEYEVSYGGSDWDFGNDIIEIQTGQFIIVGETQSFGNGNKDGWILKFEEGSQQFVWSTTVGTVDNEILNAVTIGNNGDYFTVGKGTSPILGDDQILINRFSLNGDSLWSQLYGDSLQDFGNDIKMFTDGNLVATGTRHVPGQNPGISIFKIDTLGNNIYDYFWGESTFSYGQGNKVLELSNNRIGVVGTVEVYPGNTDMFLAYSSPNLEFFAKGATHGDDTQDSFEEGNSFVYLNDQDGFAIGGMTDGYGKAFTSGIIFKTDSDCFTFNNDYDIIEDTSNILNTSNLQPELELRYNSVTSVLKFAGTQKLSIQIFNLLGQLISETVVTGSQIQVNRLVPQTGMYITLISNSNGTLLGSRKMIVTK